MKIYIVTARCDTSMETPMVFKTRKEAEQCALNYIFFGAKQDYEWMCGGKYPSDEEIKKWCKDNGFDFWDYYYWNGNEEALEAEITEVEI